MRLRGGLTGSRAIRLRGQLRAGREASSSPKSRRSPETNPHPRMPPVTRDAIAKTDPYSAARCVNEQ